MNYLFSDKSIEKKNENPDIEEDLRRSFHLPDTYTCILIILKAKLFKKMHAQNAYWTKTSHKLEIAQKGNY